MPVQPTYPGVYVQEVPSGVRTIVGVSTSVTAFVGTTKRGPINKPVMIFNYSEFETRFGGLDADSEMSYAVRSFFLNGGGQAIIVRLAKDASPATTTLLFGTLPAEQALMITALEEGQSGNNIEARVDYNTNTPGSTFNLTLNYISPDAPSENRTEKFTNLSMNSFHPGSVERKVNGISDLVTVSNLATVPATAGTASSAGVPASDVAGYLVGIDATHNQFRVAVNGTDPVTVTLVGPFATLAALATAINGASSGAVGWTCAVASERVVITSAATGENSRVEILPAITNDVSVRLQLGPSNGGTQVDAAGGVRPLQVPDPAVLTGTNINAAALTAAGVAAAAGDDTFAISLNGNIPQNVELDLSGLAGSHAARMTEVASRIQASVRGLRPGTLAYDQFTCISDNAGTPNLVLTTGSRGTGSSISITEVESGTIASLMGILGLSDSPANTMLAGGSEFPFDETEAYGIYIGNRADREGIYALEGVDIFNILCLPGISNSGILMDSEAYCRERRAFMIIDAPYTDTTPTEIAITLAGTALPKSDYAAVYYPWIRTPDPLNGGQPRSSAPCGTMAGLYARTDANRGVWKAPAGTEANLVSVVGTNYTLTDPENGMLNPLGINCLRSFPVYGPIAWGARTLRGADQLASEYKYIPVRRLALFIEESLYRGLKWAVFEPNDEPLWAQIRLNVGAFMQNLFRQGAFQGQKRDEAYFVKCDSETTTQNDINLGIVNVWVGFAPLKPAEFVILYLQQIAGKIEV